MQCPSEASCEVSAKYDRILKAESQTQKFGDGGKKVRYSEEKIMHCVPDGKCCQKNPIPLPGRCTAIDIDSTA